MNSKRFVDKKWLSTAEISATFKGHITCYNWLLIFLSIHNYQKFLMKKLNSESDYKSASKRTLVCAGFKLRFQR